MPIQNLLLCTDNLVMWRVYRWSLKPPELLTESSALLWWYQNNNQWESREQLTSILLSTEPHQSHLHLFPVLETCLPTNLDLFFFTLCFDSFLLRAANLHFVYVYFPMRSHEVTQLWAQLQFAERSATFTVCSKYMNTERAVSPNRTKFQTALTLALSNKHVECEVDERS